MGNLLEKTPQHTWKCCPDAQEYNRNATTTFGTIVKFFEFAYRLFGEVGLEAGVVFAEEDSAAGEAVIVDVAFSVFVVGAGFGGGGSDIFFADFFGQID